jgi:hypothetical protein
MCWGARPRRALPWETLTPRADNENPPGPRVRPRRGSLPAACQCLAWPPARQPATALQPVLPRPADRGRKASFPRRFTNTFGSLASPSPRQCLASLRAQARGRPFTGWRKAITARGGDGSGKAAGRAAPVTPDRCPAWRGPRTGRPQTPAPAPPGGDLAPGGRKTPAPAAAARDHPDAGFSVMWPGFAESPLKAGPDRRTTDEGEVPCTCRAAAGQECRR